MAMNPKISVRAVKNLGDGRFSVRLDLVTQSSDVAISHTETVRAEGRTEAVRIARQAFGRWLGHVMALVASHPKTAQS